MVDLTGLSSLTHGSLYYAAHDMTADFPQNKLSEGRMESEGEEHQDERHRSFVIYVTHEIPLLLIN